MLSESISHRSSCCDMSQLTIEKDSSPPRRTSTCTSASPTAVSACSQLEAWSVASHSGTPRAAVSALLLLVVVELHLVPLGEDSVPRVLPGDLSGSLG